MSPLMKLVSNIIGKRPRRDDADLERIRGLIVDGADLETINPRGMTAYELAVSFEIDEVAALLAELGADTSRHHDVELIRAALDSDGPLARSALMSGANPTGVFEGNSPLEIAVYHGSADVVEALISSGVAVPVHALSLFGGEETDITDCTIDVADGSEDAYSRIAAMLLARGASPHVRVFFDRLPLIEAFPADVYPNIHRVVSAALDGTGSLPESDNFGDRSRRLGDD